MIEIQKFNALKAALEEKNSILQRVREQNEALEKQLAGATARLRGLDMELANVERLRGGEQAKLDVVSKALEIAQAEALKRETELAEATRQLTAVRAEIARSNAELAFAQANAEKLKGDNTDPPVIALPDSLYRFNSGSAVLTGRGEAQLKTLFKSERFLAGVKHARVNTIEVIGFTDTVPVSKGGQQRSHNGSNLDEALGQFVNGTRQLDDIKIGSNADLGLLRALIVGNVLQRWLKDNYPTKHLDIHCYSAAQTLPLSDGGNWLASGIEDQGRRRVEIHFLGIDPTPESAR